MTEHWHDNIKNAPRAPGVYLMKDADGKVIYVGKAKDLGNRTRAYLNRTDRRFMIPFLTSKIKTMEFIVTGTEKEALILENNLIKKHRPRYNVYFRDDKTYYSIRIDMNNQTFPRFQLVRQVRKDGARYFGPFPSGSAAKETLHYLQTIFPLRTCSDRTLKSRGRPCLEYQIKRCPAPCAGLVERGAYELLVKESIAFLEGRGRGLIADLSSRMKTAAYELNFEEAAVLRDRINALETTLEKQRIVSATISDQDVFGLCREGNQTLILVLNIRKGKLLGKKTFPLISLKAESEAILSSLIVQYYDDHLDIPAIIITPCRLEDGPVIAEWLTEKTGKTITLTTPEKGRRMDLLSMANQNAVNAFHIESDAEHHIENALQLLREKLGLKNLPERMECFDISNISGKYAVGSLVTFVNGRPFKEGYRRFRIKTLTGMDDYGMMREILRRHYEKKEILPDLAIVDGGKGQLGVAVALFRDLGIDSVDLIGMAKESRTAQPSSINKAQDRIYLPRRKDPVYLARWPAALFLLQQIRNEAHRFALAYHHKLKEKSDFHSFLDDIPGIGVSRKKALLHHFGDINNIKAASPEQLQKVQGIGKDLSVIINNLLTCRDEY